MLTKLVDDWLQERISTPTFIERFWPLRGCILDRAPEALSGRFGELISDIESAISAYSELPEEPHDIDERQLRIEGSNAYRKLLSLPNE